MSPTRKPSKSEEPDKTDYLAKRSRNNEAVRRSREKARMKAKDTHERVSQLKQENEMLEERIKLLTKELTFLKDIFLAHAGNYIMFVIYNTLARHVHVCPLLSFWPFLLTYERLHYFLTSLPDNQSCLVLHFCLVFLLGSSFHFKFSI